MQQYAYIYLLLNYSTCFWRPSRPSSGVHKTAVAASVTDHTVWGTSFLKPKITMHGTTNIKFIDAKQEKGIYHFNNNKKKLQRANAVIWYSETCRLRRLTPAYTNILINESLFSHVWGSFSL